MKQPSAKELLALQQQVQQLKERISTVGRWHLKHRKADSTRIWKLLYNDIECLLKDERYAFTESDYISIVVYPHYNKYSIHVHKHICSYYHGLVARRETDYNKVISEINSALIHYNLALIETPESKKVNTDRIINLQKEYDVKFVKPK